MYIYFRLLKWELKVTLLQPGAADKRDYEGPRAAASSGLSRVRRVGGVVGMLGV